MKKLLLGITIVTVFFCTVGCSSDNEKNLNDESAIETMNEYKVATCDGIEITENCEVDGIAYSVYKYHPAEEEKSHIETTTTYTTEITGYCTLCNDGTRSPSCSTGRGTCSHHGGVAQWDAPIYEKIPHEEKTEVIDKEAVPEYYEKIAKE